MKKTEVLIIGAGPTGLALALWLSRMDIQVRIIDKTAGPGTTSRATVFHARNLEFYHQLGIDQQAIAGGIFFNDINLWANGKKVAHVEFGTAAAQISPYPYALIFPQDKQEALLIAELSALGVSVERETELVSFENLPDKIAAVLKKDDQVVHCEALYIAGCDGGHSAVRHGLEIEFAGGDYARTFYVADAQVGGAVANGQMHGALDEADFFIVFPMKGKGNVRLIGTVPDQNAKKQLEWADVSQDILARMKVEVKKINWFSTYRVHHRVAASFRKGNAFLLGDAGHIHSPVGGQGMNTGIGDAVNLAWKLRDVIKGRAGKDLLDTYEVERIAFARELVSSTDRAFTLVTKQSWLANFIRLTIVPRVLPFIFRFDWARRSMFRTMSQTNIKYPQSGLSEGKAGRLKGGDRLPWTGDNFDSLRSLDWQVHCYGLARPELVNWCKSQGIALNQYEWNKAAANSGFKKDAAYVVRPDGYIGLAQPQADVEGIRVYLQRV